jgi:hypothetical protein
METRPQSARLLERLPDENDARRDDAMQDMSLDRAWEQRYRLPMALATQIACLRPERGLAIAVTGGSYQLHAWQAPFGRLTQVTFGSANIQRSHLTPDG